MSIYLAMKEMWRHRGRFFLVSLVIALITMLVLFVAALAEGLGNGNKEYLDKLNADLIAFKSDVDLQIASSRFDRPHAREIERVPGVRAIGQISFANVVAIAPDQTNVNIALIGVEPGKPGEPPVTQGRQLTDLNSREALIDSNVAYRTGLRVGDEIKLKTIQGSKEEYYTLRVVGITDSRQFYIQPGVIVPHLTWERIRPGVVNLTQSQMVSNIVAIQLDDPAQWKQMAQHIEQQVNDVQVVDRQTAYEATPGYSAQQSTLNTQRYFALFIGILVIGGFFQIQTLQKVPQIGVLKAIGASTNAVALAAVTQILLVTMLGVAIGTLGTLALSLGFPPTIPIIFTPNAVVTAVISLLLIGPLGGIVSVRYATRVEPLTAIGLTG